MIIIDDKIIILMNPKCGTTSIHKVFNNKKFNITFRSSRRIEQCALKYNAPLYNHGNLKSVEYYCKFHKKNIKDYYIISLIRNPYKRYLSWYEYSQKKNEGQYTFTNFITYDHLKQFNYDNFCQIVGKKVDKVIDIKNFKEFWNKIIVPKFKVPFINNIPRDNQGSGTYEKKYKFTDILVKQINQIFYNDFKEGMYPILNNANQVNEFCKC